MQVRGSNERGIDFESINLRRERRAVGYEEGNVCSILGDRNARVGRTSGQLVNIASSAVLKPRQVIKREERHHLSRI